MNATWVFSETSMESKEESVDWSDNEVSIVSRAANVVTAPFHALTSKQAQRAYVGTFLFAGISIFLLVVSSIAYWVFYYSYVPQIGLERIVHLQFGERHPWGTADFGNELASSQPYDVSVVLQLPRTPSNLATGNFMIDLSLMSSPSSSGSDTSPSLLVQSCRPAILTYSSSLVDTARKLSRMPLYIMGWAREAEKLEVKMMESVVFARGWKNVPRSLRLEIHSREQMQVYNAIVTFRAKFTGLRWIMYNWRLSSFFVFATLFWSTSMFSTSIAWWLLSAHFRSKAETHRDAIKNEEAEDERDDVGSVEGSDDPYSTANLSDSQHVFPTLSRQMPLRYPGRIKKEDEETVKQEEIETPTNISPLIGEADDEDEELSRIRTGGRPTDSGIGTSLESSSSRGVQRRRSRQLGDPEKEAGN